ncbi:hypothetical protein SASPL_121710 [Salvia splendens]|uniref:Aminotransferase class I/classII large domain-containing protein n=1 Tax=Salvia splendens TaxID=180675 RepID=A0A8X8ZWF8_SALSN|nr:hypothetical protein SASPL_121710 [Salvia splendens]
MLQLCMLQLGMLQLGMLQLGLPLCRCAIAEYLSKDLPYNVTRDDVFLTDVCTQAMEAALTALARPGANILLPRPGYPDYEARAAFAGLEVRHYDLVPELDWEVDLAAVEALGDKNTAAIVIKSMWECFQI